MDTKEMVALAERVGNLRVGDNALDVLCDVALFEPCSAFTASRANAAGTKVILTRPDGSERTFWAGDWTVDRDARAETVKLLRARARATLAQASSDAA